MVSSRDDIIFSMYWSQCCKGCIPISVETETCLIGSDAQILLPQQRRPCLFYRDPARLPWEEVLSRVDYILATKYKTSISFLTRCSFSVSIIEDQATGTQRRTRPRAEKNQLLTYFKKKNNLPIISTRLNLTQSFVIVIALTELHLPREVSQCMLTAKMQSLGAPSTFFVPTVKTWTQTTLLDPFEAHLLHSCQSLTRLYPHRFLPGIATLGLLGKRTTIDLQGGKSRQLDPKLRRFQGLLSRRDQSKDGPKKARRIPNIENSLTLSGRCRFPPGANLAQGDQFVVDDY